MALPMFNRSSPSARLSSGFSAGSEGGGGYSPIFGGKPRIKTPGQVQGDVSSILDSVIPGFSGLSGTASKYLDDLMNGRLPPSVVNEIQDAGAAQAVAGGMPGGSREWGNTFAQGVLRNIGGAAEERKTKGLSGLLSMLQGYSGTAALTPAQVQDQSNTRAIYDSAPVPAYAIPYMMNTYKNAAGGGGPAAGGKGPGSGVWTDVWKNGMRGREYVRF